MIGEGLGLALLVAAILTGVGISIGNLLNNRRSGWKDIAESQMKQVELQRKENDDLRVQVVDLKSRVAVLEAQKDVAPLLHAFQSHESTIVTLVSQQTDLLREMFADRVDRRAERTEHTSGQMTWEGGKRG